MATAYDTPVDSGISRTLLTAVASDSVVLTAVVPENVDWVLELSKSSARSLLSTAGDIISGQPD